MKLWVMSYELWVMSYGLWVMSYINTINNIYNLQFTI